MQDAMQDKKVVGQFSIGDIIFTFDLNELGQSFSEAIKLHWNEEMAEESDRVVLTFEVSGK